MHLKIIKSEGLAHNSYYLSSGDKAAVIDPRRDCQIYTELAAQDCAEIKYILETHRNEDYVTGSLELQNTTEAEIGHSKELPFKYGQHNLSDDDTLKVGNLKIKAVYTPGHTNESLSFIVFEDTESQMVFTGDTLFAGSVGRTDLYGKQAQQTQAERLHDSLHEKLLMLSDDVLVYPAHGAGSVCGSGISGQEPTTIGYEKRNNPYLKLGKEEFIKKNISENLVVPRYFKRMEEYNLNGPPLLTEMAYPKSMLLPVFEEEMQEQKMIVIDTRLPYAFAGAHIPNSLSMWLGGTSVYPGWLMDTNQYIVFVHERAEDIDVAATRFRRLGFDNMCGYLCGGMNTWQETGKPFNSFGTMSAIGLKSKLDKGEVSLLDVREPHEWTEDGYIKGARLIPCAALPEKTASLPKDKPIAITCSVGNRASLALSILERAGFSYLFNTLGGMTAWTKLGYLTKRVVNSLPQFPS